LAANADDEARQDQLSRAEIGEGESQQPWERH
jgi:hypothetical protein